MTNLAGLVVVLACLQPFAVLADGTAATAAAAATAVAVSTADSSPSGWHVPCQCPAIYDPVCGSDGKTYSNTCVLLCISRYNCRYGLPPITVIRRGECPRQTCACSKIYSPLCGSDGHTYANRCLFDCENERRRCLGLPPIYVRYNGACTNPGCCCSNVNIPVCGTDNITYRNVCILNCISRYNEAHGRPGICVKHRGPCTQEYCNCNLVENPVCASDGKTFTNICVLRCENRRRASLGLPPLTIQHPGRCCGTACPAVYDPVCASNRVTFANTCILEVENRRRANLRPPLSRLTILHGGVCPCRCSLINAPVCASNNKTFSNRCLLDCENERRRNLGLPLLAFVRNGPCPCVCTHCSRCHLPVCGSDGVTYQNQCWLDCYRWCRHSLLHKVHDGPCGHC